MTAVTWAVRGFFAAMAAFWAVIAAAAVRDWLKRGRRVTASAPASVPPLTGMPPTAQETQRPGRGLFCLWCHPTTAGRAGRCGCDSKCPDVDHCIGDYTMLGTPEFTAQLERMLHEGGAS